MKNVEQSSVVAQSQGVLRLLTAAACNLNRNCPCTRFAKAAESKRPVQMFVVLRPATLFPHGGATYPTQTSVKRGLLQGLPASRHCSTLTTA